MSHTFTFTITVELAKTDGKFVAREELAEALTTALEEADPQEVTAGASDSTYAVEAWDVTYDGRVNPARPTSDVERERAAQDRRRNEGVV